MIGSKSWKFADFAENVLCSLPVHYTVIHYNITRRGVAKEEKKEKKKKPAKF